MGLEDIEKAIEKFAEVLGFQQQISDLNGTLRVILPPFTNNEYTSVSLDIKKWPSAKLIQMPLNSQVSKDLITKCLLLLDENAKMIFHEITDGPPKRSKQRFIEYFSKNRGNTVDKILSTLENCKELQLKDDERPYVSIRSTLEIGWNEWNCIANNQDPPSNTSSGND